MAFFAGGSYILVMDVRRIGNGFDKALTQRYVKSTEAMLMFDLIITWLVTSMIIWKLYRVGHRAMNLTGRKSNKYLRIITALVESGMLYSVVLGVFVGLWFGSMVRTLVTLG